MLLRVIAFLCLLLVNRAIAAWIGAGNCIYNTDAGACIDGRDNIVKFTDCGRPNSILKFSDMEILTYDFHGTPICCQTKWNSPLQGFFEFPGKMKFKSGTLVLNRPALHNPNILAHYRDYMLVSATQINTNSPSTQYCQKGQSSSFWVPDGVCYQHFCDHYTNTTCNALNANGIARLPQDLPLPYQGIFDSPSEFVLDLFFKGKWSVMFELNHSGHVENKNVIGCAENAELYANINPKY